ncbi:MAG: zinc-finger domain-containing protein [Caulobacter sp.]|nr:zinc-finger domain-containing protein [Caulobacter sp.]
MARKVSTKTSRGKTPTATPPEAALFPPPETVIVRSHRIACEGEGGALGHPRVWLEMGGAGWVDCPYCDRRFVAATAVGDEDERLAPGVYEGSAGH